MKEPWALYVIHGGLNVLISQAEATHRIITIHHHRNPCHRYLGSYAVTVGYFSVIFVFLDNPYDTSPKVRFLPQEAHVKMCF